jgi:hypothetical protein
VNWEAVGAIGEVVGAFGVILTLGYLAIQIRQNSAVVRSATRQAISTTQAEVGFRLAENAELRSAALHYTNLESTVRETELAAHFYLRAVLRTYENQYHQHVDGTFDDSIWSGYRNSMAQSFTSPATREFWEAHRSLYSPEFAEFIESDLLAASALPPAV